ncbi:DUF2625 family protein [Nocardiopsis algeriensis]|uniref:DUF2625 family protein n=1 Tax=Nocardiopsis algeriensis TaxID=1478215 RepID=A0A841IXK5_9ACTN|nr:DUF2625 family protein [Nocardiopsis algeriensis]MBB6122006.1 hypothetical protein [Nocardiopsis algeriensis]
MRELSELVDVERPAWPVLSEHLARSGVPVRVLPVDSARGRTCLHRLQVTARSFLGAMALECGGLVLDDGWVRVHGGGGRELPGLGDVNDLSTAVVFGPPLRLTVGHDVLGGVFALNGPGSEGDEHPGKPGEIVYFSPGSLGWVPLEMPYSAWLLWLLEGGAADLYDGLRWPGWREEARALDTTQGLSFAPRLCSAGTRENPASASRRPVAFGELTGAHRALCATRGLPDPGPFGLL